MDNRMFKFLDKHRKVVNGASTIISQDVVVGAFNITRKNQEEFWNMYCDILDKGNHLSLAERPDDVCPVLNDTDIKFTYDKSKHDLNEKLYDEGHVKGLVKIYQKQLKTKFVNYKPKHGICFVLEKEKPTLNAEKNIIGHGFHLHFINAFMHKADQKLAILQSVRQESDEVGLFEDIGIVNSEKCIDDVSTKYWLLYGSKKKEGNQYYKITKIYNDNCKEISIEEALDGFVLYDFDGNEIDYKDKIQYYLPRILSLSSENKETLILKHEYSNNTAKKSLKTINESKKKIEDIPVQELLKRADELVKMLSPQRADNYNDWIEIGWILHSISDGSHEGFYIWKDFSQKTTKENNFNETYCLYQWEKMKQVENAKTIASLYHYAKIDNPDAFRKFQEKKSENLIHNALLNKGQHSLAAWLHEQFKDQFVCASIDKDMWYEYKEHRWHLTSKGVELRKKITSTLIQAIQKERGKVYQELSHVNNNEDEDMSDKRKNLNKELQEEVNTINRLISKLEENTYKNGIMKECQELFYDKYFLQKLDQDPELMHFTNGILDLRELRFREGKQSDYISMTTGYEYKDFSKGDIEVMEAEDYLSKTFPDDDIKQYFVEYCSSLLKGGNFNKTFLVMTGIGDNGKSVVVDMLYGVLGEYAKPLPTSLIFGKRTQSSGATPELASIVGIRFSALQESNKKDNVNIGILKELTGNDTIYARGLNRDPIAFKPQLKISLICNKLPQISADDQATWNRLRVLPFESCFPEDENKIPEDPKEQKNMKMFRRDPDIDNKIKRLKSAFVWIFFQTFIHVVKNGKMQDPDKVLDATGKYRERNDFYAAFIKERMFGIPEGERTNTFLSFHAIYTSFSNWWVDAFPNSALPSKIDVFEELKIKLRLDKDMTISNARINSFRLKTNAELQGFDNEKDYKKKCQVDEIEQELSKMNMENLQEDVINEDEEKYDEEDDTETI